MTERELIDIADSLDANWRESYNTIGYHSPMILRAIQCLSMHSACDVESGDVDAPTGHFVRVGRWIAVTDSLGFHHLHTYETDREADRAFSEMDDRYSDWDNDYVEL